MAHGAEWQYLLFEMLECESGAISSDGTEGKSGRGVARVDPDGFTLVSFLSVLEAVVSKVARVRN